MISDSGSYLVCIDEGNAGGHCYSSKQRMTEPQTKYSEYSAEFECDANITLWNLMEAGDVCQKPDLEEWLVGSSPDMDRGAYP